MAKFAFRLSGNTHKFDYSALINGSFSGETDTGFTVQNGSVTAIVTGQNFIYADGTPIDGTIEGFTLRTDGMTRMLASGLTLSVSQFATDLTNHDTAALQADLFGGNDGIAGSDHHDDLYGYGGNDTIKGRGGADIIDGGAGHDRLTGGDGADTFVFDSTADSKIKAPDVIFDLSNADTIDLHRIDADTTQAGNQAFTLVEAFDGHAGQATLAYNPELDRTSLMLDVNGDGSTDSTIYLQGDQTAFTGFVL